MLTRIGAEKNLRFLILEVRKQLQKTHDYLKKPSSKLIESIIAGDDYIDNLKSIIQRKCYLVASEASFDPDTSLDMLKAADVLAVNLERIADFCENIISQTKFIENEKILKKHDFEPFVEKLIDGVDRIEKSAFERDVEGALAICRVEYELDRLYAGRFRKILEEMKKGENVQTLITVLFIYRYFERMGDALLNIGEAILSARLGERIKIDQFRALGDSLEPCTPLESMGDVSLSTAGETRSGCRIDRVTSSRGGDGEQLTIFKTGRRKKLAAERKSLEQWHEIMPGLVPKVYSYHEDDRDGSILVEYLRGRSFEDLLLRGTMEEVEAALGSLCQTLTTLWEKTRNDRRKSVEFMRQLNKRLPDVYAVHPDFRRSGGTIGSKKTLSFGSLVSRVEKVEESLKPACSVFSHGDFNIDNVIFNPQGNTVYFIDVHRSGPMDPVQDVSVFLVSNHRLQVFDSPVRRRINRAILRFHEFALGQAVVMRDTTYSARLALGLARSFASSTRFVLDRDVAKTMFLKSRYLLERLLAHRKHLDDFEVPREVLVD